MGVKDGTVSRRLKDGRTLSLRAGDPQLRHVDHAWASTVHAFQRRTVDTVIAAMEVHHPHLTTQKSFYVEISRARDRAELVTDDAQALKERLEAVTGERISALEAIGENVRPEHEREHGESGKALPGIERSIRETSGAPPPEREIEPSMSRDRISKLEPPACEKGIVRDMGLRSRSVRACPASSRGSSNSAALDSNASRGKLHGRMHSPRFHRRREPDTAACGASPTH